GSGPTCGISNLPLRRIPSHPRGRLPSAICTWSFFVKPPTPSNQSESSTLVPILNFLSSAHSTQLCHISLEDTVAFAFFTQHSSNHCWRISCALEIILGLLLHARGRH